MNKNEFMEGMHLLQNNYNKTLTTEQLRLYYENLKDLSKEKYIANVNANIKNNSFMPNVAQLRGEIKSKDWNGYEQRDYSNIDFTKLYANLGG